MAIRNFAKYGVAVLAAAACTVQEPSLEQAPNESEPVSVQPLPSVLSVEFTEEMTALIESELAGGESLPTKAGELGSVLQQLGAVKLERVFPDAGEYEARSREMGLHRFYTVVLDDSVPPTKAAAGELAELPGVVSAHIPYRIQKRGFNDPYLKNQWHLVNSRNKNADVNVQSVWEQYTTGSNKVIVCVVDEPVEPTHKDLKDNLWTDASGHTGYNFARSRSPYDLSIRTGDIGHGTHVAGVISAVNNNDEGVSSIAGGDYDAGVQGVLLQSSAIFSGVEFASDAQTAAAVKWGADHGAVISQNSWGYSADGILGDDPDYEISDEEMAAFKSLTIDDTPEIKAAIDYFIKYAGCDSKGNQRADSPMKGGLVVFAAGNEDIDWDIISTYTPIISVGAFNDSGGKASYSNWGSFVDIAAPGGEGTTNANSIWSTVPYSVERAYYNGRGWAGTSMACPHVSGAAALIVSYFGREGFTADDCRDILFSGLGNTIGGSKPVGKKLDIAASFAYGIQHYPSGDSGGTDRPAAPRVTLETSSLTLKAHETASVGFQVTDPNGDRFTVSCETGSDALYFDTTTGKLEIAGWKAPAGTYNAVVSATDTGGLTGSATLTYTIEPNHAPQKMGSVSNMMLTGIQKVGTVPLEGLFSDPDGETLRYSATSSNGDVVGATLLSDALAVQPLGFGEAAITLIANDFLGESASLSFRVVVVNPEQPVTIESELCTTEAVIHVGVEKFTNVMITLYSSTGAWVMQQELTASAFNPIRLDLSTLAPGRYTVEVKYNDVVETLRIMKY